MKGRIAALLAVVLLTGCSQSGSKTLGAAVDGNPISIAAIGQADAQAPVVFRGTMTQKCPVAGCWFTLRDGTGTIKVDTRNAGFVVVDVPLNAMVTVMGSVVTNGAERFIDAAGMCY